jgi:hypothetical protein
MKIFIATRHGAYMQGVVGVYTSEKLAEEGVERARSKEPDNYHFFDVEEAELDADALVGM